MNYIRQSPNIYFIVVMVLCFMPASQLNFGGIHHDSLLAQSRYWKYIIGLNLLFYISLVFVLVL